LSGGLRAPRCVGVIDLPAGGAALWLAPVHDTPDAPWSVERFATAARHLGEFSALQTRAWKSGSWGQLPHSDWRSYLTSNSATIAATIARVQEQGAHPLVRLACPAPIAKGFANMWARREELLAGLEQVPVVVAHGDAQRRNLFADGERYTMAIDWANTSMWPVGAEIATLIHQALAYFNIDMAMASDLEREVCAHYCEGLTAAGWVADAALVRFAYATQLALSGVLELGWVARVALDETRHRRVEAIFGRPVSEILARRAAIAAFLLARVRDATGMVP
jgi:hypothetical protein